LALFKHQLPEADLCADGSARRTTTIPTDRQSVGRPTLRLRLRLRRLRRLQ